MYGELKRDIVEIIKKLCEMKQVALIDGKVCRDHIHMYVAIPPKMSVSEFMSYLKEYADAFRQTSRISKQMGRQAFLGKRLLCFDGRQCERRDNTKVHSRTGRK